MSAASVPAFVAPWETVALASAALEDSTFLIGHWQPGHGYCWPPVLPLAGTSRGFAFDGHWPRQYIYPEQVPEEKKRNGRYMVAMSTSSQRTCEILSWFDKGVFFFSFFLARGGGRAVGKGGREDIWECTGTEWGVKLLESTWEWSQKNTDLWFPPFLQT